MAALDVDSLFTNIPLEETIDIVTHRHEWGVWYKEKSERYLETGFQRLTSDVNSRYSVLFRWFLLQTN